MTENGDRRLHISVEKSWLIGVVAALVVAMISQFIGVIWWAASTSTRLTQIELRLTGVETQLALTMTERMTAIDKAARLEQQVIDLTATIKDLTAHVASVETYLHTQVINSQTYQRK